MKRMITRGTALLCLVLCIATMIACGKDKEVPTGLWEKAVYQQDLTLGDGEKSFVFAVVIDDKTVTFTVKTDKTTVGEALLDAGLIAGEEGPYGLYVKSVNGITADYDVDGSYWCFCINGQMAMTGVDATPIAEGETYGFVYMK